MLENIKKSQTEIKNTITEIKYTLGGGIQGRLDDTEVRITKLEDKVVEIMDAEQKRRIKNKKK